MSKSASGGASRTTSKVENNVDKQTQDWIRRIYTATQQQANAGGTPIDPRVAQAGTFYSGQMGNADVGSRALAGDADALRGLMDPYQQQVIDANGADWQRINAATNEQVNQNATLAGAFGGSRHGVAAGTALARNNQAQAAQTAQLRSQGYADAMNRAGQLVNFGFGGAQGNFGVGQYARDANMANSPMEILRRGLLGLPYGTTQYGSGSEVKGSYSVGTPW